jgi:hypothetical protein
MDRVAWLGSLKRRLALPRANVALGHGKLGSLLNLLVNGVLVLLLWASMLCFPQVVPGPNLDHSWWASYGYFFKHHLRAGVDYVFTGGPLGYFQLPSFDADLFWARYVWEVLVKLLVAFTLVRVTRAYPFSVRVAALLLVTVFGRLIFGNLDVPYELLLLVQTLALIHLPADASPGRIWLKIGVIAVVTQIKFTFLVFAGGALLAAGLALVAARRFSQAVHLTAAWVVCFLGMWVLLGQRPADLPAYLVNFLQISSGYTGAMATVGDPTEIALCLSALGLLVACLIPRPAGRLLTVPHLSAAAVVGLCLFIEWKHGFVRHDDYHAALAFAMLTLVPLVLPAFFPACDWRAPARVATLTLAFVLGLASTLVATHQNYDPAGLAVAAYRHARHNLHVALRPNYFRRQLEQTQTALAIQYHLPQIQAVVGDAPVDIWSYEQAVLLLNRLNFHPRPVFQGYKAYTPALRALNPRFFRSDAAPPFLIFKLQTIDNRHPLLDDSAAFLEILRRYQPVLAEHGYLLLRKQASPSPVDPSPETLRTKAIGLNEEVALDDVGDGPVKVALDVRYTGWGKWRASLYKPPILLLRVRTADQAVFTFRLPLAMARDGFLINPLLLDNADVLRLYGGRPTRRVVSFCLVADPATLGCFRRRVDMTLQPLASLVGSPLDARETGQLVNQLCYYMLRTAPVEVQAGTVYPDLVQGTPVLVVHADGVMRFQVPAGATELTGQFGITPGAYEGSGHTDGVQFVVEYRPEQGSPQTLFSRYLDPLNNAQDRGMQTLRVPLPGAAKGELLLRTTNLPGKNCNWDWSYWTGVGIQ